MENSYIEHFWKWFSKHHKEIKKHYFTETDTAHYWTTECRAHLKAIEPELDFEIWMGEELLLIITALGVRWAFASADELVTAAPYMRGWNFRALYPAIDVDAELKDNYDLTNFDPFELAFDPTEIREDQQEGFLILYAKENREFGPEDENTARFLLYDLMGERLTGTHFSDITIMPVDILPDKEIAELLPIGQLPLYFPSGEFSDLKVDKQGKIIGKNKD